MSASESLPVLEHAESSTASRDDRVKARRTRDVSLLWIAIAVLVLSFTLRIRADQRVELLGLDGLPAPEMCGSRAWF